jgi:hypothetical protein
MLAITKQQVDMNKLKLDPSPMLPNPFVISPKLEKCEKFYQKKKLPGTKTGFRYIFGFTFQKQ